jgi:hypothetical protein
MVILQSTNLALRFLLELCALAALGYWGFKLDKGIAMRIVFGLGSPLAWAVVWGIFGSPKAAVKLSAISHFILELLVFGLPSVALYAADKPNLALIYGMIVVINRLLMYVCKQ